MELSWSTFILEIINFLVLLWILKRFLYQPVLDVIARRRKAIEAELEKAETMQQEAESLKAQYDGRVAEWETERRKSREQLSAELDQVRAQRLAELQTSLEEAREKARAADRRAQADHERAVEQQALRQAAAFSGRLLGQAAGPELEARLLELLIEELQTLSPEQRARLHEQWGEAPASIEVSSAFDIDGAQRDRLQAALQELAGPGIPVDFRQDPELMAGLRIVIGAWVLAANVRDELQGFAEIADGPR